MGSKDTNFSLNADEIALLSDASFFIKKKLVTERVIELFGGLETEFDLIRQQHQIDLPDALQKKRGKISRGENYLGLPYVILDCPALFEKNGIIAFRTLLWWGKSFSFTFHLSGIYLEQYLDRFYPALPLLDRQLKVCINTGQWVHHQEADNYIPITTFLQSKNNNPEFFRERGFLKLTQMITLDQHPILMESGKHFMNEILNKLK